MKCAGYISGALLSVAACAVSCTTDECTEARTPLPQAQFFAANSPSSPVVFDSLYIAGIGAPLDSALLANSVSQIYMPLRIDSHLTSLVLRYKNIPSSLWDTVHITADPLPWFISIECGVAYRFRNADATHTLHFLDSVACVNDADFLQSIVMYFKTDAEL